MGRISIKPYIRDLKQIDDTLVALAAMKENVAIGKTAINRLVSLQRKLTEFAFKEHRDPDANVPWKALSRATTQKNLPGSMLDRSGLMKAAALKPSVKKQSSDGGEKKWTATITMPDAVPYSGVQQFGGGKSNIPARSYFAFMNPAENVKELQSILESAFEGYKELFYTGKFSVKNDETAEAIKSLETTRQGIIARRRRFGGKAIPEAVRTAYKRHGEHNKPPVGARTPKVTSGSIQERRQQYKLRSRVMEEMAVAIAGRKFAGNYETLNNPIAMKNFTNEVEKFAELPKGSLKFTVPAEGVKTLYDLSFSAKEVISNRKALREEARMKRAALAEAARAERTKRKLQNGKSISEASSPETKNRQRPLIIPKSAATTSEVLRLSPESSEADKKEMRSRDRADRKAVRAAKKQEESTRREEYLVHLENLHEHREAIRTLQRQLQVHGKESEKGKRIVEAIENRQQVAILTEHVLKNIRSQMTADEVTTLMKLKKTDA